MHRNQSARLETLDGLRGLAILSVVIHHGCLLPSSFSFSNTWNQVASMGFFGGELFLVLSGYFMTTNLIKVRQHKKSVSSIYFQRYLRLLPLYVIAFFVCAIFIPLLAAWAINKPLLSYVSSPGMLGLKLGFCTNFAMLLGDPARIFSVSWTLCVQEQFYLFWIPFCLLMNQKWLKSSCWFIILLAAILRVMAAAWPPSHGWIHVLPFFRMDAIAIGNLIAILAFEKKIPHALNLTLLTFLATISLFGFLALVPDYGSPIMLSIRYLILGALATMWLLTGLNVDPKSRIGCLLTNSCLTWYGKHSYSIYLFHSPIQYGLFFLVSWHPSKITSEAFIERSWLTVIMGLFSVLLVIPVAWLTYKFIEKPIEQWRKRNPVSVVPLAPETTKMQPVDSHNTTVEIAPARVKQSEAVDVS